MDGLSWSLVLAAVGVAAVHTLLGPDHYLPFVMLARARGWTPRHTVGVAAACGAGHVLSSVALGGLGLALGVAIGRLEGVESARGDWAAWALVAFGLAYGSWGVRRALRRARGLEPHARGGEVHLHHRGDRRHLHPPGRTSGNRAPFWALFAIFVLGPCEPLIPLFLLPASRGRWGLAAVTAAMFAVVTIATMMLLTWLGAVGYGRFAPDRLERWDHALAGGIIALSALAILFMGL